MTKARDIADNAGKGGGTSNLIINGSMEVAQRGTSSTSGGYVSLDRWYVNQSGGSTTFSQETNSNPSETDGLQKYARLNVSTSSDYTSIRQPIEDVTSVPAGTVTISFYAKGTAPTGGLYIWGTQDFGTSGSSDVDITPVLITASLTSSWVRYTAQITIPSIDGKTINAGSFVKFNIGQYSNTGTTAYDLNITGVQLEAGDKATDFEHRTFRDELAKCQRYFEALDHIYFLAPSNNTDYIEAYEYATVKRTTPTLSDTGFTWDNGGNAVYTRNTESGFTLRNSVSGRYWFGTITSDAEL